MGWKQFSLSGCVRAPEAFSSEFNQGNHYVEMIMIIVYEESHAIQQPVSAEED